MGKVIAVVIVVVALGGYLFMRSSSDMKTPAKGSAQSISAITGPLKEFTMTAYYDAQGKWFSLKEIAVKKGDHVRIKVTNTAGVHNINIDEFGVKADLPLNQEVAVDFTADKVGSFQYYCAMPGHRAAGQWGTLMVTE